MCSYLAVETFAVVLKTDLTHQQLNQNFVLLGAFSNSETEEVEVDGYD